MGLPRLLFVESEYLEVLCEAELEWARRLARDIEGGSLEGVDEWRGWLTNGFADQRPAPVESTQASDRPPDESGDQP